MGVEERITESLGSRLGTCLKRAEQAMISEKQRALKPLGLSVPQYAALHALSVSSLSGAQLARVCSVTPQSIASLLPTLESKGLIERRPSEVHTHVLVATLTRSGHALFRKADAAALAVEARMSAAFDATDEATLRDLLGRLTSALQGPAETLSPT